ncbi:MAG: hypothetical protein GYB40_04045 [Vibrionaceae bacterium]|nr:hypothetical protein [Vibrionaceae bacterium]
MNTKPLFNERDQQSEPLLKQLKSVTASPIYKSCFFDFGKLLITLILRVLDQAANELEFGASDIGRKR